MQQEEKLSNTRLYVSNLSYSTTDRDLMDLFKGHGNVKEARVMTERDSGKSRGFAFVEMATPAEAEKAIAVNGQSFMNRQLKVCYARAKNSNR